jgi:hypothetical protein
MASTTILRSMKLKHTIFPRVEILAGRITRQKIINFINARVEKTLLTTPEEIAIAS